VSADFRGLAQVYLVQVNAWAKCLDVARLHKIAPAHVHAVNPMGRQISWVYTVMIISTDAHMAGVPMCI